MVDKFYFVGQCIFEGDNIISQGKKNIFCIGRITVF